MRSNRREFLRASSIAGVGSLAGIPVLKLPAQAGEGLFDEQLPRGVRWSSITSDAEERVAMMSSLDLVVADRVSDITLQFLSDHGVLVLSRLEVGRDFELPTGTDDEEEIIGFLSSVLPLAVRNGENGVYFAPAQEQANLASGIGDLVRAARFHFPYLQFAAEGEGDAIADLAPVLDFAVLGNGGGHLGGSRSVLSYEDRSRALLAVALAGSSDRPILLSDYGGRDLSDPEDHALLERQIADGFSPILADSLVN